MARGTKRTRTGEPIRRNPQRSRTRIEFTTYVDRPRGIPHIISLRPTRIQNADHEQIAEHIVNLLLDAVTREVNAYNRWTERRILNRVTGGLNGIFSF